MSFDTIALDEAKVAKAVTALRQISKGQTKQKDLIEKVEEVELQICVKKIPQKEKTIKLKLPNSIRKTDVEVCLFVKDLDRADREYDATVCHFQDILKKKGVNSINEIVPLKSLKTEYKPFEAKRNLSNAYDIFLADARIIRFLPTYLGKHFYGKKKAPVQVNLQAKNLAAEIEAALSNSRCSISTKGSVSTAVVANIEMEDKSITENVIASAKQISENISGGPVNVKLLSLKFKSSTSIPLYIGSGGPQDVKISKVKKVQDIEAEEISTLFGAKIKVFPDGSITIIKDGVEKKDESSPFASKKIVRKRKGAPSKERGGKKMKNAKTKRSSKSQKK
ncbi:ribosomal l1 domain-containing protein 1 [Plakobranchus ocellatus]|uniref:Ribosomal L1 domain-containing protein 1 n=1 Tax=Plakobranchus ocellatus TaxID=259542 RepID=A0AAV3YHF2_9GAST|nr:ribosomal l1 domain-containing protein 1 [Plakobranchus ocellatus]